ncbi:hypothetical protein [Streptomyces sp. NPDC093261]|uniref:hypothetical protein n=1 Tax=Streptomyces sp. NPDC093261 TaxID=3366037 RepID=UPI00381C8966
MTIAPDEIPLCAVARAAYNASGDVLTRHQRFLGNSFEVRDGSIHISGDIFENNAFVADKNVIRGSAMCVGNNRFIGHVYVGDVDPIVGELPRSQECNDHFLPEYARTDSEGESALHKRDDGITTRGIRAAESEPGGNWRPGTHRDCAAFLAANDFAAFSAIAIAQQPRDSLAHEPVIRYADLKAIYWSLGTCIPKRTPLSVASGVRPTPEPRWIRRGSCPRVVCRTAPPDERITDRGAPRSQDP